MNKYKEVIYLMLFLLVYAIFYGMSRVQVKIECLHRTLKRTKA